MPIPLALELTPDQIAELEHVRDHDPTPYLRERAAGILQVGAGQSLRAVARSGLLQPRRRETVGAWVRRYQAGGIAGLRIRPGRGRKPAFFPRTPAQATAELAAVVHHSPRCFGLARSRWRLADLGRVVPWLQGRAPGTIHRLLRRLDLRSKRGRAYVHSPDLAYDAKLAAITAAQLLAHAFPEAVVLLYEDEFTYYRRPSLSRDWAPVRADAPRAHQAWGTNKVRRVAACLDALTGRLLTWQRRRFDRHTLLRYYRAVEAAYPAAEVIYLVQDNWPVHFHDDVLDELPPKLALLPLPTYAPWTNPVEDVWRGLKGEVLHHHAFGDDWAGLQAAVTAWLGQWDGPSPALLQYVGLEPWPQ